MNTAKALTHNDHPFGQADKLNISESANLPTYVSDSHNRLFEIAWKIQKTLDIRQQINCFAEEICKDTHIDGLIYLNKSLNMEIKWGHEAEHHTHYRLTIDQNDLGKIIYQRTTPFSATEIQQLEQSLCSIAYALRNSIEYEKTVKMAFCDDLTGLYNRTALNKSIQREMNLAKRQQSPFVVIMLDIDHFKKINDQFGHLTGDYALQVLANCLKDCVRDSDVIFRYGGEEFTILLNNTTIEGAQLLAERIRSSIAELICFDQRNTFSMTVSAGIAALQAQDTVEQLLNRADQALYQAKERGRNQVVINHRQH